MAEMNLDVKVNGVEEAKRQLARLSAHRSGWHSTKLHLSLIGMGLVTIVYGLAGFPVMAFGEYCLALGTFAGIYSGARVSESFAQRPKAPPDTPPAG